MDESANSSDSGFEVHEVIFAESLGISLQEEFALELLELAARALYILPEGWEVEFAESELGTIPFFYDTNTNQSHWVHPYAQDLKLLIEEKRLELLRGEDDTFNEEDDFEDDDYDDEDESNIRVNESSEIEALRPRIIPPFDEIAEEKNGTEFAPLLGQIMDSSESQPSEVPPSANSLIDQAESSIVVVDEPVNFLTEEEGVKILEVSTTVESKFSDSNDKSMVVPDSEAQQDISTEPILEIEIATSDVPNDNSTEAVEFVDATVNSTQVVDDDKKKAPEESPMDLVATEVVEVPLPTIEAEAGILADTSNDIQARDANSEKSVNSASAPTSPPKPIAIEIDVEPTSNVAQPIEVLEPEKEGAFVQPIVEEVVENKTAYEDTNNVTYSTAVVPKNEAAEEENAHKTSVPLDNAEVEEASMGNMIEVENAHETSVPLDNAETEGASVESNTIASAEASIVAETPANSLVSIADDDVSVLTNSSSVALKLDVPSPATPEKEKLTEVEKKSPPKSARPLPVDPFADFFTIDTSMHTFIDALEKKQKKKKQQQQKQAKSGRTPSKKDAILEEDALSIDLDEILRNRRQEEKAKEEARLNEQKKEEEKLLTAEKKKQAIEEEKQRKKEEEEKEKQEREALEQEKIVSAAKLAAAEKEAAEEAAATAKAKALEEETRAAMERETQLAAANADLEADTINVPLVTTLFPPAPSDAKQLQLDEFFHDSNLLTMSQSTKSLYDDLIAKESVPEEEEDEYRLNLDFKPRTADQCGLSSPLEPISLDKSVDILDHFRNIYSAPNSEAIAPKPGTTSAAGQALNTRFMRQSSSRHVHGVAAFSKDYINELASDAPLNQELNKPRGLDTTKLITRDASKRKKKRTSELSPTTESNKRSKEHSSVLSPPKLKPHATSTDGWVILAAYANYKEAERAVALFEALAPTKSIAGQSFPSHSKFLPPVKTDRLDGVGGAETEQLGGTFANDASSPLKKKSLLFSNAPITKESILLSTQQELPQVRIARDLGRMQWIVECNDVRMKKVFERRIAKRIRNSHGAEKLLAHLSPAKQQALGLGDDADSGQENGNGSSPGRASATSSQPHLSPLKHLGEKFTAPFVPQSLIFNKNSKHVSGQMQVHYALPRVSYDEKQQLRQRKTGTLTMSSSAEGHHIQHQEHGAKSHRGPLTFRAALQEQAFSRNAKKGGASWGTGAEQGGDHQHHRHSSAKKSARPASTHL
jgi:hypothetical protein